nr:SET domain-containing protein [Kiritimatiellia bacterium]
MKPAPHGRDRNRRATSGAGTVEVRSSRVHGRGVFAKTDFPARRKLGEVGGHWVALPEARRRVERDDRIYLVELDEHTALDCSEGNAFGRLNHHCSPNCYLRIY